MRKNWLFGGIFILLAGSLIGYWFVNRYPNFFSPPVSFQEEREANPPQPTDQKPLFAIVIENAPESRPQSGLSLADLVIETVTEGGITRMLAFFQNLEAQTIGPVRSARPYFVDWALGFNAIFAYSGGSKEALEKIADLNDGIKAVNEFYYEKFFWRNINRNPPHNLFTSTALLSELAAKKGWETDDIREPAWEISTQSSSFSSATATEITINFSYNLFGVEYQYNPERNSYDRFLAGKPHVDAIGQKQISIKNVVVLYTTSSVIDRQLLTIDLETTGTGRAVIFRDGKVLHARWKKEKPESPLRLLEADDSLIKLNPGSIWFAVLDQQGSATWK